MSHRIQLRRDKAAFWAQADPVLAQGELAWSTDTGELKIGDGTTPWSELSNILDGGSTPLANGIVFQDPEEDGWVFEHPYPASTTSTGGPANGGIAFDDSDPENVSEIQISQEFAGSPGSDSTDLVGYLAVHNFIAIHDETRGGAALYRTTDSYEIRNGHIILYVEFVTHQENNPLGTLDGTTGAASIKLGSAYLAQNGVRVLTSASVDFNFWDNMSGWEPNTLYIVNHEAGDDEPYGYRRLYLSVDGNSFPSSLTPEIPEGIYIIPMFGDTGEGDPEDINFDTDSSKIAAIKAINKDSSGFFKTEIELAGSPQNNITIDHGGEIDSSRVVFAFTGSASGASETFPEIFVKNNSSTESRLDQEWMDNTEFAFINKSDSTVILDSENAGVASPPSLAYVSIQFDKVYTLEPGEFVLLRYDHDSEIFRQEKQSGSSPDLTDYVTQTEFNQVLSTLSGVPITLGTPIGVQSEITHTGTGYEPIAQAGFIREEFVAAVQAGAMMVLELNLNYYIKPNGTQPLVRLKLGNIEVKLPSGNIPGSDSFLYFDGTVTLFISKPGADLQIKALTRFRSYESFAGGGLQDDLVHFPGDYLGNDDYTVSGNWAVDGAWEETDPWIQFNADLGIKARLEKASGQVSLAM